MADKVVLTGGGFQDAEGNVLANGYLTMKLNQDEQSPSEGQIGAGITLTIPLDENGDIADSPEVWPNDVLIPTNSYYIVFAFTEEGQQAWGPFYGTVDSPSPFDVTTWVPAGTAGATINAFPVIQVNDVNAEDQSLLDLVDSDSITFTDLGNGQITAEASGGSLGTGSYMFGPGYINFTFINGTGGLTTGVDNRVRVCKFSIPVSITFTKCSIDDLNGTASHSSFGFYTTAGIKLFTSGVFTGAGAPAILSNTFAPVTLPAGTYYAAQTCDGAGMNIPCINVGSSQAYVNIGTTVVLGKAANPSVTGVLPNTLGAITIDSDGTFACPLWES